jgi:hypothetical protein
MVWQRWSGLPFQVNTEKKVQPGDMGYRMYRLHGGLHP